MDDFDKMFNRTAYFIMAGWAFMFLLACSALSGIGFVVYKVLAFYGVM